MAGRHAQRQPLNLQAGEVVEVRSVEEILATLDTRGALDAVPFMPEMLPFCDKQFRVGKRSDKSCDTARKTGMRTTKGVVHLEDLRCGGTAHGGCEAGCLLFWKEEWLKRVSGGDRLASTPPATGVGAPDLGPLYAATQSAPPDEAGEPTYACQATEHPNYTTPLRPWSLHYWRDVKCGNARWRDVLWTMTVEAFNALQRRRNGITYPPVGGTLTKTPVASLNLVPGNLVQVKSREEILATLNVKERNRGLLFDREMVPFCGGTYRVERRVTKIIDEGTGKMMPMKGDCIVLEGVACEGRYNKLCPRAIVPYWREIWLEPASSLVAVGHRDEGFGAFAYQRTLGVLLRRISKLWPVSSAQATPNER